MFNTFSVFMNTCCVDYVYVVFLFFLCYKMGKTKRLNTDGVTQCTLER